MDNSQWKHRFVIGLREFGLTFEEVKQNWKYAGGNKGRHYNYWILLYGEDKKMPPHEDECICKHKIKENCYITDSKEFLVVGNCCIKRFMIHNGRTCEECNQPHKTRSSNVCNGCREKHKREYYQELQRVAEQVETCCVSCSRKIDRKYTRCFQCYQRFQETHRVSSLPDANICVAIYTEA